VDVKISINFCSTGLPRVYFYNILWGRRMKENKLFLTSRTSVRFVAKDVFGLLVFVAIPLSLFVFNLVGEYRMVFYAILVIFIATYTLVGQFFFERARMGSLGKQLLALTVINTLVI